MAQHSKLLFTFIALCLCFGLGFAYYVQYYLRIDPCAMCFTQRYLFMAAIALSLLTIIFIAEFPGFRYLAALALLANLSFSAYHVGVEQKWWSGPSTCTGSTCSVANLSPEEALAKLKSHLSQKKFVPCDQVSWRIFGVPATVWNTLFLTFLLIVALTDIWPRKKSPLFYKR